MYLPFYYLCSNELTAEQRQVLFLEGNVHFQITPPQAIRMEIWERQPLT